MSETTSKDAADNSTFELVIKLVALGIFFIATYRIISPFLMPVCWGIIIAVAVEPLIAALARRTGGKRKAVSILFALVVIGILVIPSALLVVASIDGVQDFLVQLEQKTLNVPPPPAKVEEWPVIGESLYKAWNLASVNIEAAIHKFSPQLKDLATMILVKAGSGLKTVFMFVISIAISAALLITADKGSLITSKIINRIAGSKGPELKALSIATIRGVMQGVVGVAFIQAVLAVIGMVLVGVPAAGVWGLLTLILAIIQLPPIIVLGPLAAWVFSFAGTLPATLFLVWVLVVSGCDGVLKPILMGRGVDAPMLVILIGALGGMMLSGIIGLFVGAVIVAISYTLFIAWVNEDTAND